MKRYLFAIVIALLIHVAVVLALGASWQSSELKTFKVPQHVKAQLVVLPKATPKAAVKSKVTNNNKKKADLAAMKKAAEAAKKKAAAARKKAEAIAKKKAIAAKKKAEDVKKAEELKKSKEAATKLAEQKKAEELARQKALEVAKRLEEEAILLAEQLRIQEEARNKQEILDQEGSLLDSLDQEDSAIEAAAKQTSQDEVDAMTYYQLIERQISVNWSRPPSTRNGMMVGLEIHLLPNGELLDVFIIQSSGDDATDLSAERAVRKVSRFQVPQDIRLFERHFRKIEIGFRPEDLRQ